MANIKKSFNFRNGVQVDDDNFIVNANGLVGIGSTVPTELLDVGGNVRIRGTLYAESIAGQIINTSADGTADFTRITVGITTITSGIITATSGIITYYGDGSKLQGLPTSQWVDVDPALNLYTSIYSQGNVGIATTNPIYSLQIGGNYSIPFTSRGVGIGSNGNIEATGNIGIGSNLYVTGITTIGSNLYVTGIATLGSNLYVTGVTTSYSFSGFGTNITGINASNITNGVLNSNLLSANINKPSGIGTFNLLYANLVGIATTALSLAANTNINIASINSGYSNLGVSTATTLNVSNSIGVGTNNPNSDIHVRKNSNAKIEVTSDTNAARIIIGREIDNGSLDSFGIFRFGNTNINENSESTNESFDIINYAPGNLNYYIRPQSSTGLKFNWINYSSNIVLASLTADGKLGLGKTNPTETFEVVGTSTITSDSYVGGDFSVSGNITANSLSITQSPSFNGATFNKKVSISTESVGYSLEIGSPFTLNAEGTSGVGVGIGSVGNINASGTIRANRFIGIGSQITQINGESITGTLNNININAATGIITANRFIGIGSQITQISPSNISSGTLGDISINTTTGIITAKEFIGIGSQITQISPSNISSGTLNNININAATGIITAKEFIGIGSQITQISPSNISSGTLVSVNINSPSGIITAALFDGTFNTSNFILANVYQLNVGTGFFQASAGVAHTIATFTAPPGSNFYSLEYSLIVKNSTSNYQSETISIVGDSTVAISTEYGVIFTPTKIGFCTSEINSSEVKLYFTPQSGISGLTSYRYVRKKLLYTP